MLALTDSQLKIVMAAARSVPAMLALRGRFDDSDVRKVAALAACGLITANAA
jgi:hypothetical protein